MYKTEAWSAADGTLYRTPLEAAEHDAIKGLDAVYYHAQGGSDTASVEMFERIKTSILENAPALSSVLREYVDAKRISEAEDKKRNEIEDIEDDGSWSGHEHLA